MQKKIFPTMIYEADMTILISNFDNFDKDQISEILLCLIFLLQKNFYPRQSWWYWKYQIKPFLWITRYFLKPFENKIFILVRGTEYSAVSILCLKGRMVKNSIFQLFCALFTYSRCCRLSIHQFSRASGFFLFLTVILYFMIHTVRLTVINP